MNALQTYFLIIGILMGVGLPLFLCGIILPSAVEWGYMEAALEYVILDQDSEAIWSEIPGMKKVKDLKEYYIFECTNSEEVAVQKATPNMTEVGPFPYLYTDTFTIHNYITDGAVRYNKVNYSTEFKHKFQDTAEARSPTEKHRVLNIAGLKRWKSVKERPRFHIAIESFYELFRHSVTNLERDMIRSDLISSFKDESTIKNLLKDISVSSSAKSALATDTNYGLKQEHNLYSWTYLCDEGDKYLEHEYINYLGIDPNSFGTVKSRFCEVYDALVAKVHSGFCNNIPVCSAYNISFNQWMYGEKLYPLESYANISYKKITGFYELNLFITWFKANLKPEYKEQFENIEFPKADHYEYLLYTEYSYPDFVSSDASVLIYDNMHRLFVAGEYTESPLATESDPGKSDAPQSEINLIRFDYY